MWMSLLKYDGNWHAKVDVRVASDFLLVISVKLLSGANDSTAFSPFEMAMYSSSYAQQAISKYVIYTQAPSEWTKHQFLFWYV